MVSIHPSGAQAGILLRSAFRGYLPDKSFIIVTMVVTGVFLVGWRTGQPKLLTLNP